MDYIKDIMSNNLKINNMENFIIDVNLPSLFYPIVFIILFLIISLITVFFKINLDMNKNESKQVIVKNVLLILFFVFIILFIAFTIIPRFSDIGKLFYQISNVSMVILYTIFIILFFSLSDKGFIDKYANYIVPSTLIIGFILFMYGMSSGYMTNFNFTFERIKMLILLMCLLTLTITYYNNNPGGIIKEYFGYTFIISILLITFGFLYLFLVILWPTLSNTALKGNISNFFSQFTYTATYGTILYFLFIITISVFYTTYKGGILSENKSQTSVVIIITLLISIFWGVLLMSNLLSGSAKNITEISMNSIRNIALILFGLVVAILLIVWIVFQTQQLSSNTGSGIYSFILNLFIILAVLGLIYKTIIVRLPVGNSKKNAFLQLFLNILFYIPCLFTNSFDTLMSGFIVNYDKNTTGYIALSCFILILITLYLLYPTIYNKINLQDGNQLVNEPIPINQQVSLGNYQTLNKAPNYDYNFALSFWFYIDALPPNTNPTYKKYISLLNYANKPNILYKAETNSLVITYNQSQLESTTDNPFIEFEEGETDSRIIYENKNVLLQRWNNIVINYSGGTLDVFLNGNLEQSNLGVVPYYNFDALTVGTDESISGKICNVTYFNHTLSSENMFYLYKMVKDSNPPTLKSSNIFIIK